VLIAFLLGNGAIAQEIRITGTVTSGNGDVLPGVSIIHKSTSTGTTTDASGNYTINVSGDGTLVFSFIGFKTTEVNIASRTRVDVVLEEDVASLDEVVVVGYGTQKQETVSAAVSTVKSNDLVRGISNTTAGAVVGKVSGVTWRQKDGAPGAAPRIQIRNGGDPLYVIDGVMTDANAFNNIDQNDIEELSILKDGAAAIYGVRASNGVVLVTTKRGKINQKTTINFNTRYGVERWASFPDMLNPYEFEYSSYMREVNLGEFHGSVETAKAELEKWKKGYYNPETGEDYRGYDYFKSFVNDAPNAYYNLSANGGGDKINYSISASHVNQDAVFKDYNFKRYNVRASVDAQITEHSLKLRW
jgi:TonB-dependent SusC/RagA subfamily outer membrane receptor